MCEGWAALSRISFKWYRGCGALNEMSFVGSDEERERLGGAHILVEFGFAKPTFGFIQIHFYAISLTVTKAQILFRSWISQLRGLYYPVRRHGATLWQVRSQLVEHSQLHGCFVIAEGGGATQSSHFSR